MGHTIRVVLKIAQVDMLGNNGKRLLLKEALWQKYGEPNPPELLFIVIINLF